VQRSERDVRSFGENGGLRFDLLVRIHLGGSAPSTALWRALSPGVGAVGSTRRCVGASVSSVAGSAKRLFSLSA
jgi:hypothetical protein